MEIVYKMNFSSDRALKVNEKLLLDWIPVEVGDIEEGIEPRRHLFDGYAWRRKGNGNNILLLFPVAGI